MQRFLTDSEMVSMSLPEEFSDDLKPIFPRVLSDSVTGSLRETLLPQNPAAGRSDCFK